MKKVLTSVRPFIQSGVKPKFCADCGTLAAQEALFRVDESATVIEKYCDRCIKNVK
ncbi:MAG: hypothetical protein M3P08_12280 [Thermoproteota archaeon]|jgi:hypothetical protein|nr:hypothetical protein [Thermoproteota archaeon]